MRNLILSALLLSTSFVLAEETVPAPAPAVPDTKAQAKEIEMKMKVIKDEASKDPAIVTLKTAADDAKKAYETAVEAHLKENADYQALKKQQAELRGAGKKKEGEKKEGGEKKEDK